MMSGVGSRLGGSLVAAWLCLAAGCAEEAEELPPYGEVVIEIDTDLDVPTTIDRIRIDIFRAADGTWLETLDRGVLAPVDLPLSFSVYGTSETDPTEALVRVRLYSGGHVRDYCGERFASRPGFTEPVVQHSLADACANATELPLGQLAGARFRGAPFEDGAGLTCDGWLAFGTELIPYELGPTDTGLAVYQLEVSEAAEYRVEVIEGSPGAEWFRAADTILSLRSDCADPATEIVCNVDASPEFGVLSGLTATLQPGTYFALVGNLHAGPMDVTVLAARADQWLPPDTPLDEEVAPCDRGAGPRLIVDGDDLTPPEEPHPELTVDRLALIEIMPGNQVTTQLLLAGDCIGTMADVAGRATCVDVEGELVPLTPEPTVEGHLHSVESALGTWEGYADRPCQGEPRAATVRDGGPLFDEGVPLFDEQVCVPGGSFTLGDQITAPGADASQPERIALIPPFFMDRYEYTVGRYRDAVARGFEPPDQGPYNNIAPLALHPVRADDACTWNTDLEGAALHPDQERLPLSCVTWYTARALCQFDGGDLPTVAQREYAASAAGREHEAFWPWGNEPPQCSKLLYGRWIDTARGIMECAGDGLGTGPQPPDAEPWASADVTPTGVVGLGGSMAEWTLDSHRAYTDACWRSQPLESPRCWEEEAPLRTLMGASWRGAPGPSRGAARDRGASGGFDSSIGLRCVTSAEGD